MSGNASGASGSARTGATSKPPSGVIDVFSARSPWPSVGPTSGVVGGCSRDADGDTALTGPGTLSPRT